MMKIGTTDQWTQRQLIEYDADGKVPIKYDLCAALAASYIELNKRMPRKGLEDAVVSPDEDVQSLFDTFVEVYEEVHGNITNNGKPIKSQFAQVKIGGVNDSNTHEQLMQKLYNVVEYLK
jgi:hypothetical protein